jgi:hypothetical protein
VHPIPTDHLEIVPEFTYGFIDTYGIWIFGVAGARGGLLEYNNE